MAGYYFWPQVSGWEQWLFFTARKASHPSVSLAVVQGQPEPCFLAAFLWEKSSNVHHLRRQDPNFSRWCEQQLFSTVRKLSPKHLGGSSEEAHRNPRPARALVSGSFLLGQILRYSPFEEAKSHFLLQVPGREQLVFSTARKLFHPRV